MWYRLKSFCVYSSEKYTILLNYCTKMCLRIIFGKRLSSELSILYVDLTHGLIKAQITNASWYRYFLCSLQQRFYIVTCKTSFQQIILNSMQKTCRYFLTSVKNTLFCALIFLQKIWYVGNGTEEQIILLFVKNNEQNIVK